MPMVAKRFIPYRFINCSSDRADVMTSLEWAETL